MIRRLDEYRREIRENMRGGNGSAKIEHLFEPCGDSHSKIRMFGRLTLEPGSSIGFHRHDNEEEIFYILNGTAKVSDDGEFSILKAGETMRTGDGSGHSLENVGDTPLELVAVIVKF